MTMKVMRQTLEINLRDQLVFIEYSLVDPDPDVGLMGYDFDDPVIRDEDENELDWELTDEEADTIRAAIDGREDPDDDWEDDDEDDFDDEDDEDGEDDFGYDRGYD